MHDISIIRTRRTDWPVPTEWAGQSVVEPKPALLRLLLRHLQPLPSPDPCDPLAVHHPTGTTQHRRDATIAVAAVLEGKRDDVGGECRLVVTGLRDLALRGAMLAENPACKPLRDAMLGDDLIDASATTGGAQKFPRRPLSGSASQASDPTPHVAAGCSQLRDPSAASPGRPSGRHTPDAIDSR